MWVDDGVLKDLDPVMKNEIVDIIRSVEPGYSVDLWCGYCVAQMIEHAFELNVP